MRVIVCGGRNYDNRVRVFAYLDANNKERPISLLIEGGAQGADTLAGEWATARGIPRVTVWANWEGNGKSAGPVRNQRMIDLFAPQLVIAFSGGKGTADMVGRAKTQGIEVREVT